MTELGDALPTVDPGTDDTPDVPEEFWDGDDDAPPRGGAAIQAQLRTLIEWVAVAVGALLVALLIKAFLLQAFYIPSASMHPTLYEGDRVLVNKLSYRLGDVQRGDVIVFECPHDRGVDCSIDDFIKRVIALPGEAITFVDGQVYIDGRLITEGYIDGAQTNPLKDIPGCTNEAVRDRCVVPDGTVFVMGDNRGDSQDSRVFGPIDQDTIVGRAFVKVWPIGDIGFL